jgi:5-methylthioribose kinase
VFEVDQKNVLDYLQTRHKELSGWPEFRDGELSGATASELAWGVSNIVLRVDTLRRSFVVKQSRKQLRTPIDWFSQLERVWREVAAMRALDSILPLGTVPRVLFEDRENYLFAMEAVEADHLVWKAELLDGRLDVAVAARLGMILAMVHRDSRGRAGLQDSLGDRTIFDELRLDPFYRYVAQTTPDGVLAESLRRLIDDTLAQQECLVLADFSPKNILLTTTGPVVVDFETAHIGDPGFDIGFFLSHILLKVVFHRERLEESLALAREFWREYRSELDAKPAAEKTHRSEFERRCVRHLGACMLARVDGKSRVDYLTEEWQLNLVRSFCRDLLTIDEQGRGELTIAWCFDELARRLAS